MEQFRSYQWNSFPQYKSMGNVSILKKKLLQIEYFDMAQFQTRPRFLPVLVACKFDEDPIKYKVVIDRTTFSPL